MEVEVGMGESSSSSSIINQPGVQTDRSNSSPHTSKHSTEKKSFTQAANKYDSTGTAAVNSNSSISNNNLRSPSPGIPESIGASVDDDGESVNPISPDGERNTVRNVANWSLSANVLLFVIKLFVFALTLSYAVLASLVDSSLDLVSQMIMFYTEKQVGRLSDSYPAGKTRLEPVSVLIVSILMCISAFAVIRESVMIVISGKIKVHFEWYSITPMIIVILLKFGLYLYCRQFRDYSPIANALAEDHLNDVLSNGVALAAGVMASYINGAHWMDPCGAIVISFYIIYSWIIIGREELQKLIGHRADDEYVSEIRDLCENHSSHVRLDILRAYHIGRNLLVEVEIIMPSETPLKITHDTALDLQKKIERFSYVERAFVHVDYLARDYDEHKPPQLL